jgi:chaperonin GroEL
MEIGRSFRKGGSGRSELFDPPGAVLPGGDPFTPSPRPATNAPMAPVSISFGTDARLAMLQGVERLERTVAATLGPSGRTVLIEREGGGVPRVTKDGVTVADALEEEDRWRQLGLRLVRRAAQTVAERVGDGTTTTVVLAHALFAGVVRAAAAGLDAAALRRAFEGDAASVAAELRRRAVPLRGPADVVRIATLSANGEAALGRAIADAWNAVGAEGIVTVEAGQGFETTWEKTAGWQWEGGYVSPYFMTDPETTQCVYDSPLILLTEAKLDDHRPLLKLLEMSVTQRRPLLVVAEEVSGEALKTLVANKIRGGLRVVAGKAPLFGDRRRDMLEDVAAVIGARLVSERRGDTLSMIDPAALGGADRVVLTKDRTTIVGGAGSEEAVSVRAASIRAEQGLEGNTPFQEKTLRERLARLAGGVAVLRVGGSTEAEISERRDRADDASSAVRAALAGGILPGGGAAYIHAAAVLGDDASDAEARAARDILRRALAAPAERIARNAGHDGRLVAARIGEDGRAGFGFDAASGRYGDLMRAGVIDPAEVAIAALEAAASVAALLLATETVIAKPPPAARPTSADDIPFGPEAKDMTADEAKGFGLV